MGSPLINDYTTAFLAI